jgi:hypothetical protein
VGVDDSRRLLARRSEFGYTDRVDRAMNGEPEAVSREEQHRITAEAQFRARRREALIWLEIRGRIERDLGYLQDQFGPQIANELRAMRRELDRLGRRLA